MREYAILTPAHQMTKTDRAKLDRVNPRNFSAMTESTVMAMAFMTFGIRYNSRDGAVAALKELPISTQHALDKSKAQAYAKQHML
jgi:hypothetical protein